MVIKTPEKSKLTAFEKELAETARKVKEFKLNCEANIVAILYKDPELCYSTNLQLEEFSNNIWKVYWKIADDLVKKEKKSVLDEVTVGFYLEKHDKLKQKYDEYGGYDTISKAGSYVEIDNFEGYINELRKWNVILRLAKLGFPVNDRLSDYCDMTSEEIYDEQEALLNDTFINIDYDIVSYDINDGIDDLLKELDEGMAVGLPYHNLDMITKETGGQSLGNITLVGGLSNVGKSTFSRNSTLPSIVKNKERIVIMLNEEGKAKWQREFLVWIANNIFKEDLAKYIVRDGHYSKEVWEVLEKSKEWLAEQTQNKLITIIPFKRYKTNKVIKVLNKYSSMGVKYFMLDTFKLDAGQVNEKFWAEMQQNMVELNDVVKAEAKNLHFLITFQLGKSSAKQRYYTQDNIGMSKSIIDPVSTCIMIRNLFDDEYSGEKRELKVYRLDGKNHKTKIPVKLEKDKQYQIIFIIKNREGSANSHQIVVEHDLSKNILREVGVTNVPIDF